MDNETIVQNPAQLVLNFLEGFYIKIENIRKGGQVRFSKGYQLEPGKSKPPCRNISKSPGDARDHEKAVTRANGTGLPSGNPEHPNDDICPSGLGSNRPKIRPFGLGFQ